MQQRIVGFGQRDDSATYRLGRYIELEPHASMSSVVEYLWAYLPAGSTDRDEEHLVLPDSSTSLAFGCARGLDGGCLDPACVFMGPTLSPHLFQPTSRTEFVAVKLFPEWARTITTAHPAEHVDGVDGLRDINPSLHDEIYDRLVTSGSWREALRILEEVVAERVTAATHRRPVHDFTEILRAAPPTQSVAWCTEQLAVSQRHFRRVVSSEIGLSPKRFSSLQRFLWTVRTAERVPKPSWSRMAAEAGYADQAHLIHEFRRWSGETPANLHRTRRLLEFPTRLRRVSL